MSVKRTRTGAQSTPDKLSHTECTDPTADQKAQQAMFGLPPARSTDPSLILRPSRKPRD